MCDRGVDAKKNYGKWHSDTNYVRPLEFNDLRPDKVVIEVGCIYGCKEEICQKEIEKSEIFITNTAASKATVMLQK